jgi:hypothetical protein
MAEAATTTQEDPVAAPDAADQKIALAKIEEAAANAAFEAIMGKTKGKHPTEEEKPDEPEPAAEPEPEPAAAAAPAPPKPAEPEPEPYEKRFRTLEGTIGGLRSDLKKQREAFEQLVAKSTAQAGSAAPSPQQIAAAQGSPSKMAAIRAQFPDFADALEEGLKTMEAGIRGGTVSREDITKIVEDGMSTAVELAELRILWGEDPRYGVMKTPEFAEWMKSNPDARPRFDAAGTAREVIKILNEFKATQAKPEPPPPPPKKDKRLDASIPATSGNATARSTRIPTEDELQEQGFYKVRPKRT